MEYDDFETLKIGDYVSYCSEDTIDEPSLEKLISCYVDDDGEQTFKTEHLQKHGNKKIGDNDHIKEIDMPLVTRIKKDLIESQMGTLLW